MTQYPVLSSRHEALALTPQRLAPVVTQAITQWAATGLTAGQVAFLQTVPITIADLSARGSNYLGLAVDNRIEIDNNAAGYGWSLDTVHDPSSGRVDLLTVVMHELGHVLGFDHSDGLDDVMFASLSAGVRHHPTTVLPHGATGRRSLAFLFRADVTDHLLADLDSFTSVRVNQPNSAGTSLPAPRRTSDVVDGIGPAVIGRQTRLPAAILKSDRHSYSSSAKRPRHDQVTARDEFFARFNELQSSMFTTSTPRQGIPVYSEYFP